MRTPEQNLDGVMRYLKHIEPQREAFEKVTRYDFEAMQARLDCLESTLPNWRPDLMNCCRPGGHQKLKAFCFGNRQFPSL